MKTIKAIGFDYGGVIGGNAQVGREFRDRICSMLGIDLATWKQTYFSLNHLINDGTLTSSRDFWRIFLERLSKVDQIEAVVALDNSLSKVYETVNPDIINLIDALRTQGYKVGLLSNAAESKGRLIRDLVASHFDVFLISSEIGVQKPDKPAFNRLAEDLGVTLEELVFVDDSSSSLSTAKECGFIPILFESYSKLITELKTLDISY